MRRRQFLARGAGVTAAVAGAGCVSSLTGPEPYVDATISGQITWPFDLEKDETITMEITIQRGSGVAILFATPGAGPFSETTRSSIDTEYTAQEAGTHQLTVGTQGQNARVSVYVAPTE